MEIAKKMNVIKDPYHITQGIFYLLSTLIFTPDVFMYMAREYWMYIFRPIHVSTLRPPKPNVSLSSTGPWTDLSDKLSAYDDPFHRNWLQVSFPVAFNFSTHFSSLAALFLVIIYSRLLPQATIRIGMALCINLFLQVINLGLSMLNTDEIQTPFFIYAIILIILINGTTSIIFVSLFELVIKFPTFFAASLLSGQPICGLISVTIHLALIASKLHPKITGAIYFSAGALIGLFATLVYYTVTRNSKYFIYRIQQQPIKEDIRWNKLGAVLCSAKWYYAALLYLQGTTNTVHPGITALIVPMNFRTKEATSWEKKYFVSVITFFGYSFCNLIGRELAKQAAYWKIKRLAPRLNTGMLLMFLAFLRSLMVPLLIFCNGQTRKYLPVYFGDNSYIIILAVFAFSDGLLVNITILKIFLFVDDAERREAFILIPFCIALVSTICTGFGFAILARI